MPGTRFVGAAAGIMVSAVLAPPLGAQDSTNVTRICLAPATVEASSGNATAALDASRESFTAFLTGPSLKAEALKARLESQAREEAKQAGCPWTLFTSIKVVSKKSSSNLLGHVAAGAVREGAYAAGAATGTAAGRIAGSAVSGAANQAAYNYAVTIRNKDELTLGYRLEAADGTVLLDKREKRNAKADGEDLLTPLVQAAAEQIVAAAKR
jgi:hypothetical protein